MSDSETGFLLGGLLFRWTILFFCGDGVNWGPSESESACFAARLIFDFLSSGSYSSELSGSVESLSESEIFLRMAILLVFNLLIRQYFFCLILLFLAGTGRNHPLVLALQLPSPMKL